MEITATGEGVVLLAEVRAEIADLEEVLARESDPAPELRQHRVKLLGD